MNELYNFLNINLNNLKVSETRKSKYKLGVSIPEYLESSGESLDVVSKTRFLYVKNLCLEEPEALEVPACISSNERALMHLSFDNFDVALEALEIPLFCEVIGAEATTRTGSKRNVGVLKTYNTSSQDLFSHDSQGFIFTDFKVEPLNFTEQLFLYIQMMKIYKQEENVTLRDFKLNAYIDRALSKCNPANEALNRAFLVMDSIINNSTEKLEKIKDLEILINENLFEFPIIFKSELLIQLGLAYKDKHFYGEAYHFLLPFPLYLEKIDCLVALKKPEEAVSEILKFIAMIGSPVDRSTSLILAELYIKLGHIYQDPKYYDISARIFMSAKPYNIKGLMHFNRKEYDLAASAFEDALALTPSDEKIRFSYGCTLIELDRISEALEIFQILKLEDPMNDKITKNLSYCYIKAEDVEKALFSLKSVALCDPCSMDNFFILSMKNLKIENIKWAMTKMMSLRMLKGSVAYLSTNNILTIEEMKSLVEKNPYVDFEAFNAIFAV